MSFGRISEHRVAWNVLSNSLKLPVGLNDVYPYNIQFCGAVATNVTLVYVQSLDEKHNKHTNKINSEVKSISFLRSNTSTQFFYTALRNIEQNAEEFPCHHILQTNHPTR